MHNNKLEQLVRLGVIKGYEYTIKSDTNRYNDDLTYEELVITFNDDEILTITAGSMPHSAGELNIEE